jgi:hypothetical protein
MPAQRPQQQQMNPDMLKAKEMMLKAELLKVQAQKLMMGARGGAGGGAQPRQPQGQPPRR